MGDDQQRVAPSTSGASPHGDISSLLSKTAPSTLDRRRGQIKDSGRTLQLSPHYSSFELPTGPAARFRDKFEPSRPSSSRPGDGCAPTTEAAAAAKPTIGEYERIEGVGAGENEETCRRMTNSCVAFVSCTILVRSVDESGLFAPAPAAINAAGVEPAVVPRVLSASDSWMTV